jgi:hypothetical protein
MVDVLMPYAEQENTAAIAAPVSRRLRTVAGRRIRIVNNGWHCMNLPTEELTTALRVDYGVGAVIEIKISAAQTLPSPELERLANACDAVVVGIGTCGSCSRWVLQDAMDLERRKIPTVSLFTKVFEPLARAVRAHDGFPDLPLTILPHPLNPPPDDQIRAAARHAVGEIVGCLTEAGPAAG